jgi:hypothetical protein
VKTHHTPRLAFSTFSRLRYHSKHRKPHENVPTAASNPHERKAPGKETERPFKTFFLPEIQKSKPRETKGKKRKEKNKIKNTAMAAV